MMLRISKVLTFSHLLFYLLYCLAHSFPSRHVVFIPAPIDKPRGPYYQLVGYRTPKAAVVGVVSVVAHHKKLIFWNLYGGKVKYLFGISAVVDDIWIVMDTRVLEHIRIYYPQKSCDLDDTICWIVGFDILPSFVGVEIEMFVVHKEHIPAYSYATFDIVDLWIDWIAKDDDIAPFWSRP